jgi:hypothetical protein
MKLINSPRFRTSSGFVISKTVLYNKLTHLPFPAVYSR